MAIIFGEFKGKEGQQQMSAVSDTIRAELNACLDAKVKELSETYKLPFNYKFKFHLEIGFEVVNE